jgi:molybdopterin converting factor small subunit
VGRVDETLAQQKAEFESRLATLREQRGKARENQRKRIDARMDELKASYEARKSKLDEARQHAKASIDAARRALVP